MCCINLSFLMVKAKCTIFIIQSPPSTLWSHKLETSEFIHKDEVRKVSELTVAQLKYKSGLDSIFSSFSCMHC